LRRPSTLTPTLSRREREKRVDVMDKGDRVDKVDGDGRTFGPTTTPDIGLQENLSV